MLVLSAPSGTGKTTLSKLLIKKDDHLKLSTSVTTRPMREGEVDGKDYHFVTEKKFKKMAMADEFIEYAEIFGNFYGTPRGEVEKALSAGEDIVFDIDWQGHKRLLATAREDVVGVFILPPSKEELYKRLESRHEKDNDMAKFRHRKADDEISHWHEYDYIIINKNLNHSLKKLQSILRAERLRKARRTGLISFVENLMKQDI